MNTLTAIMGLWTTLLDASVTISIPWSAIDCLMGITVIVGAIVGYKRGVIVECISFFAVFVLLTICVNISKWVHKTLWARADVPDLFAIILLAVCFVIGLVFAVSKVNYKTQNALSDTKLGSSAMTLGAVFGALKFYMIAAVFLVTLFKIDEHAQFLPDTARKSTISRGSIWIVTSIFPYLQLDSKRVQQFEYPNNNDAGQ